MKRIISFRSRCSRTRKNRDHAPEEKTPKDFWMRVKITEGNARPTDIQSLNQK